MKGIKKLLTGILAATMIMGASITAFASETPATTSQDTTVSITIKNSLDNGVDGVRTIDYTYYQFLKAEVREFSQETKTGKAVYYVENETLANTLARTGLFTSTKAQAINRWYIAANGTPSAEDIVKAFTKIIEDNTTIDADGNKVVNVQSLGIKSGNFSSGKDKKATQGGLEPGYYLILSSLGTKAALQTLEDVIIDEKNSDTTVTKIEEKEIDAMFDHDEKYTITVTVPESPAKQPIKVVDTATVGLTLDEKVEVNGKEYDWAKWTKGTETVNTKTEKTEVEYTLSIPTEFVTANAGKDIVLKYGASVNERAVVYVPEENRAYIVYDNRKSVETKPVKVKTLGIKIIKYTTADGQKKNLTGAEFTLWDNKTGGKEIKVVKETLADGNVGYRVAKEGETGKRIVVDEKGEALVAGLDADHSYYLQEEVAPAGYTMLKERFEVVMDTTKEAYQEVEVENLSGLTLPSTGGMGTTIFYIVGSILIVAGVAYFIVRRKANAQ
ncbi:MAG: isopeptide-forming domain-containing fimbrial protein [Butyrivibrio sp.]|uniref:isopeptide-forming domain-containing fimbrial protein n=1 Tax=Butyrivibrio sp. TaxID=28121 RepID=UPI001B1804FD|nr:SpaA isopeptide-forming pilin-related protein [Butyrivibrio sp.]MBO5623537.1 isopeptide-forming domain-containing fimbrial protein [Butyrivibrio sp.]MBP3782620.1 isopeptide-forming domain-containing fimbrial protein [Butyrivibrio sp.]